MAIIVQTANPSHLLATIRKQIDAKQIDTWEYDKEGDFTHSPDQWKNTAWLRPSIVSGAIVFGLVGNKNETMTKIVYGLYHGRFAEMLLTHFDTMFTNALTTAKQQSEVDIFK